MKKIVLVIALFLTVGYNAQNKEEIFTVVEEVAEFKGGQQEMVKYIGAELKYPKTAKDAKIGGKVFIQFVVDKEGAVKDAVVIKGVANCVECDKEALRVISSMPKWTPAKQSGKVVSCYYTIPIKFDPA